MNKLIQYCVMVAVGVLVFTSLLVPVVSDAQHAEDTTYTNSAPYSYGKIYDFAETDENDTVIITVCKTGEHSISINGVAHNVATWQPVIMSDGFCIRFYSANMSFVTPTSGINTVTDATITISHGIATFSNVIRAGGTEITVDPEPITWAFVHDPTGNYAGVITEQGVDLYTHKNEIYTSNWINTTSEYFSGKAGNDYVTITDGTNTRTATINWGGEYLNDGVYKLSLNANSDDYTFIVDNAGEDYTVHPFMVCVPKEVIGTPDDANAINSLLGVIPLVVLIGLIVGIVSVVFTRRLE